MKKIIYFVCSVLICSLVCSCSSRNASSEKGNTSSNIVDIQVGDKQSFVVKPASEKYSLEEINVDFNHADFQNADFSFANINKLYFVKWSSDNGNISFLVADAKSGEVETIDTDESAEKTRAIAVQYADDEYIVYHKLVGDKNYLMRFGIKDKKTITLFDANDAESSFYKGTTIYDGYLFFTDFNKEKVGIIYKCDISSGDTEIFAYNAESPFVYNDKLIYYSVGYFTDGSTKILNPNASGDTKVEKVFVNNSNIYYICPVYDGDTAIGSEIGVYASNGSRKTAMKSDSILDVDFYSNMIKYGNNIAFKSWKYPCVLDSSASIVYTFNEINDKLYAIQSDTDILYIFTCDKTDNKGEINNPKLYKVVLK